MTFSPWKEPYGQKGYKSIPLTKVWVGTFYGFENGYYSYISQVHYEGQSGLSVVVVSMMSHNIECLEFDLAELIL